MSNFLEQLSLTPQERRVVIIIVVVVFVVLNLLFVCPRFGDWGRIQKDLNQTYGIISNYNRMIATDIDPANGLKKQLAKLEKRERLEGAAKMVESEVQLETTIRGLANSNKVDIDKSQPVASRGKTDDFFEEQSEQITIRSQEPQLINFLYQIGNDPSMIRVSELELHPADPNRFKFGGTIVLTANYAKRPASTAKPAKAGSPAAKPAPGGKPLAGTMPGGPPGPARQPGANARGITNRVHPPVTNSIRKNL